MINFQLLLRIWFIKFKYKTVLSQSNWYFICNLPFKLLSIHLVCLDHLKANIKHGWINTGTLKPNQTRPASSWQVNKEREMNILWTIRLVSVWCCCNMAFGLNPTFLGLLTFLEHLYQRKKRVRSCIELRGRRVFESFGVLLVDDKVIERLTGQFLKLLNFYVEMCLHKLWLLCQKGGHADRVTKAVALN